MRKLLILANALIRDQRKWTPLTLDQHGHLGVVKEGMMHVIIPFGEGEQKRLIGVAHMKFSNGGSWSFFRCPNCGPRARVLRLYGERPMCGACCLRNGARYRIAGGSPAERGETRARRIENLRALLDGGPARLHPRSGSSIDEARSSSH
jgi:hypothetical protein